MLVISTKLVICYRASMCFITFVLSTFHLWQIIARLNLCNSLSAIIVNRNLALLQRKAQRVSTYTLKCVLHVTFLRCYYFYKALYDIISPLFSTRLLGVTYTYTYMYICICCCFCIALRFLSCSVVYFKQCLYHLVTHSAIVQCLSRVKVINSIVKRAIK